MTSTSKTRPYLVAFDFDCTITEEDTDRFVIETLASELIPKLKELHSTVQWTDLMNLLHGELHRLGFTSDDIIRTVRSVPLKPAMVEALHILAGAGAEIVIISDANTIYIEELLEEHNILGLVSRIITNPAWIDDDKCLHVRRLMTEPHGCPNACAVNICKGKELLDHVAKFGEYERLIYAGDGRNDYCPSTKLRSHDLVLPRKDRSFAQLLGDPVYREQIKAVIEEWDTAEDLRDIFKRVFAPTAA